MHTHTGSDTSLDNSYASLETLHREHDLLFTVYHAMPVIVQLLSTSEAAIEIAYNRTP